MPHFLTQVRAAALAALANLPTTGDNVATFEAHPQAKPKLPRLVVRTGATPEVQSLSLPPDLRVDTRITVDCIVRGNADAAEKLDTIASEVTAALCGVTSINGKTVMVVPADVPEPEFSGELDQVVGRRALVFVVSPLFVAANAPDTLI